MANKKISELTEATDIVDADLVPIITDVATTPASKKITKANLLKNYLAKDNTTEFVPDANYEPATKKYVDDSVSGAGGGDMLKTTYDPTNINSSAFNTDNHTDGTTNHVFTALDDTKLTGVEAGAEVNVNADWNAVTGDAVISNKPTLGTASAKNIPALGDASATEVVYGTDSRLTDARTPASHSNTAHSETYITSAGLPAIASGVEVDTGTDNAKMVTAKAIADSGVAYTSDIPSVPVKAIGTELDTGTDDAKFTTALAIKNSHNVPSVAPSTAGNLLTSDGTDWVSSTPSAGGGQTLYDIIVAPSGGDYTTLTAALASATTGQTIFVKRGTYDESAGDVSCSTGKLTIIGESDETTICSFATRDLVFGTSELTIKNIQLTFSTGYLQLSGHYSLLDNVYINNTGNNKMLRALGSWYKVVNCRFGTGTGITSQASIELSGGYGIVSNNHFNLCCKYTYGSIQISGNYNVLSNNEFQANGYTASMPFVYADGISGQVNDNNFTGLATATAIQCNKHTNIIGNNIYAGSIFCITSGASAVNITGNRIVINQTPFTPIVIGSTNIGSVISGNVIENVGATNGVGVEVANGADDIIINGNYIKGFTTGINIAGANSDGAVVVGNGVRSNTTPITDNGTASTVASNGTV